MRGDDWHYLPPWVQGALVTFIVFKRDVNNHGCLILMGSQRAGFIPIIALL